MGGRVESGGTAVIAYCVVPRDLAAKLHEPLRRHFREDPSVEVVVERRNADRRLSPERRAGETTPPAGDRRRIRAAEGRRIGERRATLLPVTAARLPRRAQRHADRLQFLERVAPTDRQLEDIDTARLVTRFQAGDVQAFSDLYVRYFDRVYGYLRVALNDRHAAEDVTQQVFANVLEALPRYERRPGVGFRPWLFVLVRNEGLHELRKRERAEPTDPVELANGPELVEPDNDEGLIALDWLSDRDLVILVERLPATQRQVIVLRYMMDMSYADIAAILDRGVADVRTLHSRGVRFLRKRLAALGRPSRDHRRIRMRSCTKQLPVIAARRWSLHA